MVRNYSGNLSGVVDLGALAAANTAKASASPAGRAGQNASAVGSGSGSIPSSGTPQTFSIPGPVVRELTENNLQSTLQISAKVPLIIVFHSSHSDNSVKLLDIFKRLAKSYQGRFGLATVSTDEQAPVAQAFGVSAVPAAAAVLQGQPVPLFQGLPSEDDIVLTIEKLLSAAAQYGISGVLDGTNLDGSSADGDDGNSVADPIIPPLHKEGLAALEANNLPRAQAAYTQALKENPGDTEAQAALHQIALLLRMEKLNPERDSTLAHEILARAADCDLQEIEPQLAAADIEMAYGRPDAAFARLIDVISACDAGKERETVRERLLQLFDTLGSDNDLVKQARRALANVLF